MSLKSYLRAAPKAELHVRLEGSIQPATLLTLAARNDMSLLADNVAGLRDWFTYRDFEHFVEIYITLTINSDDPPLFNTTIDDEAALLADPFGLDVAAADEILLNGARHNFLPIERKQAPEESLRVELASLKRTHLPDING